MRNLFILLFLLGSVVSVNAQSNRTTETQRDRYGHIIGTAVTTTHSDGSTETVYKDAYGHIK
ncbi:MAG: hypothetical protein ACOCN0_02875, partial [Prevotella sp.]